MKLLAACRFNRILVPVLDNSAYTCVRAREAMHLPAISMEFHPRSLASRKLSPGLAWQGVSE